MRFYVNFTLFESIMRVLFVRQISLCYSTDTPCTTIVRL